ncbi:MAG: hypothetical protein M3220_12395 [Chloroflexota bacterium]|nr:hypothetical protein [Chloroflexota bacterium]
MTRYVVRITVAVLGLVGLVSVLFGSVDVDESVFFLIGQEMRHGSLPYVDLWDHKGVPIYWLGYVASFFGSYSVLVGRLLSVALPLSGCVALLKALDVRLSRDLLLFVISMGLAASASVAYGMMTEQLEAAAVLWSLSLTLAALNCRTTSRRWLLMFGAGVLSGWGIAARLHVGVYLLALLGLTTFYAVRRRQPDRLVDGGFLFVGAMLSLALVGLWLYRAGLLQATYDVYLLGNVTYAQYYRPTLPRMAYALRDAVGPFLGLNAFFFIFGLPGLLLIPVRPHKRVALFAALGIALLLSVGTRMGQHPHYWTTAFWFLALGSAYALHSATMRRSDVGMNLFNLLFLAALLSIPVARQGVELILKGKDNNVAEELNIYAPQGSRLWIAGGPPGSKLYLDTHTRPGTRYIYTGGAAWLLFDADLALQDLIQYRPIIALGPVWYDGSEFRASVPIAMQEFLKVNYRHMGTIADEPTGLVLEVYQPKDSTFTQP